MSKAPRIKDFALPNSSVTEKDDIDTDLDDIDLDIWGEILWQESLILHII